MPNQELPMIPRLSKSKYLSGLQCHKRLYLEKAQYRQRCRLVLGAM
jgi:hypothetical protein